MKLTKGEFFSACPHDDIFPAYVKMKLQAAEGNTILCSKLHSEKKNG